MLPASPRLVLLLAAVALLAAACGDDGSTGLTGTTPAAGGDLTTTGGGELSEVLERYRRAPLRTTYLTGEEASRQEITFSQDPTLDPPVSALITAEGKVIFLGDRIIYCSGAGTAAVCSEMPAEEGADFAGALFAPFALSALAAEDLENTPGFEVETGSITVAGRSGICFTYRPAAGPGGGTESVRQCVDDELGFTLLLEAREAGAATAERVVELLAVGNPQPEDFAPTGPLTPLPTG